METHFPVVPVDAVPKKPHGSDGYRPVILVVNNEPIINYTLAAILSRSGFVALTAQNRDQALETAKLIPPHVLVTDLVMSESSGLDLAFEIRQVAPDCEVILITGQISPAERSQEARLEGCGFVTLCKPVFPAELLACISERLDRTSGSGLPHSVPIAFPTEAHSEPASPDGDAVEIQDRKLQPVRSDGRPARVLQFKAGSAR